MIQPLIAENATFAILGASRGPGPEVARAAAAQGARVVAMDSDKAALAQIAGQNPDRIEPLDLTSDQIESLRLLKDSWGAVPIHLVLNLLPLDPGVDITAQMRGLSGVVRAMARGLMMGQGSIVTVVPRPAETLALSAQGLVGAVAHASRILGAELAARSVRVHVITVPQGRSEQAVDTALFLGSDAGRLVKSGQIDLG